MLALDVKGLRKTYRSFLSRNGTEALRGVDLQVRRGTAFGLIGLNGAGKTTLIKAILAVIFPTAGRVRVLEGPPEDPAVRRRIGYLPERLHLPTFYTPRTFLSGVARLKGISGRQTDISRQLGRVGMLKHEHEKIGKFSKGMKQRTALAAALLGAPDLLILDEPTDGIDPLGRADIRQVLREERQRGATIFLNSHLLDETQRLCEHVGILHAGRLVYEGDVGELAVDQTRYEFVFGTPPPDAFVALHGFEVREGQYLIGVAETAALGEIIDAVRGAGLELVEMKRATRTLEDVLREVVHS